MADETEQLARELLAAEYRADGLQPIADDVLTRPFELLNSDEKLALRAIVAALQQAQQCVTREHVIAYKKAFAAADGNADERRSPELCGLQAVFRTLPNPPPLPEGVSEGDVATITDAVNTMNETRECLVLATTDPSHERLRGISNRLRAASAALESYRARLAAKGGV